MSVRPGSGGHVVDDPIDLTGNDPIEPSTQPRELGTIRRPKITPTEDRVWRQEMSCSPEQNREKIKIPLNTKMTSVKPFSKTPRRTQTTLEDPLLDMLPFKDEQGMEYFNRVIINDQRFYVPHDLKDLFETVNPRAPPLKVVYPMHIMQAVRKVKPQLSVSKPNAIVATPVERYRITMKYIHDGHNPRVIDGLVAHIQHRPEFVEKLFYTTLQGKRIRRACCSLGEMGGRFSTELSQQKRYLSPIDDRIRPGVDFQRMYSNLEYTSTQQRNHTRQSRPLQGAILKRKLHKKTTRLASIGVQTGGASNGGGFTADDGYTRGDDDDSGEVTRSTQLTSLSGVTRLTGDIANALDTLSSIGKPVSVERVIANDLNNRLTYMRKTKDIPIIPSNVCYPRIIGMTRFQGRPTKGELAIIRGRLSNTSKVAFTQTPGSGGGGTAENGTSGDPGDNVLRATAIRKEQTDSGIQSPASSGDDIDETENDLVNEGRKRVTWSREIRQNQRRGLSTDILDRIPGINGLEHRKPSANNEQGPPVTPATNPSPGPSESFSVYVTTTNKRPATPTNKSDRARSGGLASVVKTPTTIIDELPEGDDSVAADDDDVIGSVTPAMAPSHGVIRSDISGSRSTPPVDGTATTEGTSAEKPGLRGTADGQRGATTGPGGAGSDVEGADDAVEGEDYRSTVFITDRSLVSDDPPNPTQTEHHKTDEN